MIFAVFNLSSLTVCTNCSFCIYHDISATACTHI